jgi:MSHA pilin protein MshC
VELVLVLTMIGILAVFAAPRLNTDSFATRSAVDQAQSLLRYAQKVAIAQHRNVFVVFNGSGGSLCFNASCGAFVTTPANQPANISLPSGVNANINPSIAGFYFNGLGRPFNLADDGIASSFQRTTLTVQGGGASWQIFVEPETGYVHQ